MRDECCAESENAVKLRLKSAEAAFQAAGLPESQYGLKAQTRSDRKRAWLWELEEHGFSIRIVEK